MLRALLPIEPAHLPALEARQQDAIDAFLKRFEQLVLTLQDQLFVGLAIREGEDPRELSRRDMTELMERLHAIPSAGDFRELVMIRNRLAHLYPEEPERQAANLNAAYEATPRLLEAARQAARRSAAGGAGRQLIREPGPDLDLAGERAVDRAFVGDFQQALALRRVERPGESQRAVDLIEHALPGFAVFAILCVNFLM